MNLSLQFQVARRQLNRVSDKAGRLSSSDDDFAEASVKSLRNVHSKLTRRNAGGGSVSPTNTSRRASVRTVLLPEPFRAPEYTVEEKVKR